MITILIKTSLRSVELVLSTTCDILELEYQSKIIHVDKRNIGKITL